MSTHQNYYIDRGLIVNTYLGRWRPWLDRPKPGSSGVKRELFSDDILYSSVMFSWHLKKQARHLSILVINP